MKQTSNIAVGKQKLRLSRLLPDFETAQDVRDRKANMVKNLKAGRRATRKVGRKLRRCRKDAVCSSPICPRCLRNLRKSFVLGAISCIDQVCTAEGIPEDWIVAFSAVLTEERYADGELHNADLRRINERLQRRHQRAGLPLVFAGVDISYNEDSAGRWELHWQLQVYGVCVSVDVAEVTTLLARLYPANNTTPKPLRVRHCENLADALSYLIKPYFGRRVSYLDGTGRFNTRKRPTKEGAGARVGDLDRPIPTDNSLCPDRLSAIWGPDRANEISSNELGKSTRRQRTEKGARNGVHCKLDHIKCSVLSARLG